MLASTSATIPITTQEPAVIAGRRGRPTAGLWTSVICPRADSRRASTMIVSMMITNGRPSCSPCWGSQVQTVCSLTSSDWSMPMTRPPMTTRVKEEKRASSAAPRAGTMNSV